MQFYQKYKNEHINLVSGKNPPGKKVPREESGVGLELG